MKSGVLSKWSNMLNEGRMRQQAIDQLQSGVMIRRITQCFSLLRNIHFSYGRKPRDSEVPTQSTTLLPFSINYLHDNPGARYTAKRLGRGPGSGKGKTSGRGMKGQKSRSGGGLHIRFEGGQTPLQKRLPKYGRVKQTRPKQFMTYLNLCKLDYYVKLGVLNSTQPITIKILADAGIVKDVQFGVKILGRGSDTISYPLKLEVSDASVLAIRAVEKAGGEVKLIHRTLLKLRQHLKPENYPLPLSEPISPLWRVNKLQRLEKAKGVPIEYTKPKWLVESESKLASAKKSKIESTPWIYPVPIVQNSGKIRSRKVAVYRKISYKLP